MRGPFGLEPYSTPKREHATYLVSFKHVPQPHPDFVEYRGEWKPESGLITIMAQSRTFDDDSSGVSAFNLFEKTVKSISQRYGEPVIDDSASNSEDPIPSIYYDDASCIDMLDFSKKSAPEGNIEKVVLMILAEDSSTSYVTLGYHFRDENATADDVFSSVF